MYVITANVKKKGQSTSQMTNDKDYHMILVIIIVVRGETMLQRALGSGWGVMIPGALIVALGYAGVSADVWRVLVAVGMLMSAAIIQTGQGIEHTEIVERIAFMHQFIH